ncbi:MAG: UDP-N-acetylglucosamine--N-acetylmuramyl-(pentapeptide) pyrophosphoryl-undecaprenol N-acetylglucosamine transferase [Candidatus Levybacteria bacterium]|nr:UDP-N-acetylglucosamine--N-acetylmuramyl-(pentapeptide) pyrophosphoryl-undecaprenol N-acetylglucosamine transferase [Candidatus Levybacteria bacterium]
MKVAIIGGHLSPALAVIDALPKDAKILFIGRKYALEGDNALSLEYETIAKLKIPFVGLNTGRLQRKLTRFTLFSLLKLPFGIVKSFLILIKFKPDVVVGFGGYVSIPVIPCASILKIPVVIHEQTMEAGLANRLVSRFSRKICISWNSSRKYFPKNKVVFTGNPVRKFKILNPPFSIAESVFNNKLPIIYITGGSSGSHAINVLIEGALKEFLESYNIIHQTGDAHEYRDFDRLERLKHTMSEELRGNYLLEKFIDPSGIGDLINSSSLVIARSGMNTITELLYFEKPSLLIPLPFSQNNEQLKNAKFLEKIGLSVVLHQNGLDSKKLLQAVKLMFRNIGSYKIDKKELKNLPGKHAAQNIVSIINNVSKDKTQQ